mgnify:CR=1 FL=1
MFVNDLAIQESATLVPKSEPTPSQTETTIRLTVQGVTEEITNFARSPLSKTQCLRCDPCVRRYLGYFEYILCDRCCGQETKH